MSLYEQIYSAKKKAVFRRGKKILFELPVETKRYTNLQVDD